MAHRVLLAHNRYLFAGGERQAVEAELHLLRDHGHVVETYFEDNQRIAALGRLRTAARTVWSQETYRAVRKTLRDGRFDVVHVHNFLPLLSPAIYYAARAEGVPIVQTLHNFRLLCLNGLLFRAGAVCEDCVGRLPWPGVRHTCYRDSRGGSLTVAAMLSLHRAAGTWQGLIDTYIALTEFSRQKLIDGGLPPARIRVKPNFLARDPGPGDGTGDAAGPFALYVGRLSPEKGIDTLLAGWKLLGNAVPLKIVGDGPLRDQVLAAATPAAGIAYLGRLDNEQVLDLMRRALFLVLPSLCYENFPMTVAEAFATGLPVLASDLGNTGALIAPGETGVHFRAGAATDLAAQAAWLLEHPERLRHMRATARQTYEAHYTPASNYRLLRDIYADAVKGGADES